MTQKKIPLEKFFGDDNSNIPFRIFEMKPRSSPSPLDPHRHNFYEIFIFIEGAGEHFIDFRNFPVGAKTLHFVSPGQVHWLKRSRDSHGFLIAFTRTFFSAVDRVEEILKDLPFYDSGRPPSLTINGESFERLIELCQNLLKEIKSDQLGKEEVLRAYFKIFLVGCQRCLSNRNINGDLILKPNPESDFTRFKQAVETGFQTKHQVKEYTRLLNCSHQKLNEVVKRATGQTALEFIHSRILLEAKRLLFFSDLTVKEIAYALNYDDPSNFSKFFKNKTGVSPVQFKAQQQV